MASFIDPRKRPTGVQVHISTGRGVDIQWGDGHASHYEFVYLREKCPCATCNEEREKKAAAPVPATASAGALPGLPGLGPALPMFKPKPTARQAKAVGQYAVQFDFSDGHSTGIYSFEFFRTICPCEQCARDFRSDATPQA
ncbi:MAG TPA: DUF971 domain-containing protein [Candidatus Binatia bacterium]|nr:DUF971 domain-containing protein [Candidatus Binatia bacterium]